jgi:hypothetical protein
MISQAQAVRAVTGSEPEKKVDPNLSAKRRAASAARWAKAKGLSEKEQIRRTKLKAIAANRGPTMQGGQAAMQKVLHRSSAIQNIQAGHVVNARLWIVNKVIEAVPDIIENQILIAKGLKGTPAEQTISAKFLLGEARLLAENMPKGGDERPLSELSIEELEAEIKALEAKRSSTAIVTDGEVVKESSQAVDSIDAVEDTESDTQGEREGGGGSDALDADLT